MICENCENVHDGQYSKRFCSKKCRYGFSTKNKRKEINQKVSDKLSGRTISDEHKQNLSGHWKRWYSIEENLLLRKEQSREQYNKNPDLRNRVGDFLQSWKKEHSIEYIERLKEGIQSSVEKGNWSGWQKRYKNNSSYAELFFEKVFDNMQLKYEREKKINRFFADFAFEERHVVLEIDGKQHEHRKDSDYVKDEILSREGWKVFRIAWKNPVNEENKLYIEKSISDFIKFLDQT